MKRLLPLIIILVFGAIFSCVRTKKESKVDLNKEQGVFPEPAGYVNDFENLLSGKQQFFLDSLITDFEKRSGNEICVVSSSDMYDYSDPLELAVDLGNYWGVGKKELDNGMIIFVSAENRNAAIATGEGIEEVFTDKICQGIIEEQLFPKFSSNQFFEGFHPALDKIMEIWSD